MKTIRTEEAVGHVLCHDITQIIRGVSKGPRFRKGHIVQEEDIPVLLSIGKDHLYVWEKDATKLHENEAAEILRQISQGSGTVVAGEVKEGKIELVAQYDGLLKVDVERLLAVNELDEIIIATRHNNTPVKKGAKLAGMRVIPLVIEKRLLSQAQAIGKDVPLLHLLPYRKLRVGVVTTGNEVFHGRIKDTFTPVVTGKLKQYGLQIDSHLLSDDQPENILAQIEALLDAGMEMILCTGGMSVDPDDKTPAAIRQTGAKVITYGAPVLPGAMFLLAYYERKDGRQIPIMGLPGCVMYAATTIFDLVLPRVIADDTITKHSLRALGHGGLCFDCERCTFPDCALGKG